MNRNNRFVFPAFCFTHIGIAADAHPNKVKSRVMIHLRQASTFMTLILALFRAWTLPSKVVGVRVALGLVAHFVSATCALASTTNLAGRPAISNHIYAVNIGTWCGNAVSERTAAQGEGAPPLPYRGVASGLLHHCKSSLRGSLSEFVNHSLSTNGNFDAWFVSNPGADLPYWTNEAALLQASSLPTNFFVESPTTGLFVHVSGYAGLTTLVNRLLWTGRYAWPYQSEQKIATGNPYWWLGHTCAEAYSDNESRWASASYVSEDDFLDGVFYGVLAESWSEPDAFDIASSRKRANALIEDITSSLAHGVDLYLRAGDNWFGAFGPLYLRDHYYSTGGMPFGNTCPDGGGYNYSTYKMFGSLAVAVETQRIFNTKSISSNTWPFAAFNWTCPLPAIYPDNEGRSFVISDAVAVFRWDVTGGFQYLNNAPSP